MMLCSPQKLAKKGWLFLLLPGKHKMIACGQLRHILMLLRSSYQSNYNFNSNSAKIHTAVHVLLHAR